MITYNNTMGKISLGSELFVELVSQAVAGCFGVAGLAENGTMDALRDYVQAGNGLRRGVKVSVQGGKLQIELHIKVGYGVNIASITQSIAHRVKHEVESATGLHVVRIDVLVDDVVTE